MALTMLDKTPVAATKTAWPAEIAAEFERETKNPNGCVGKRLLSENERVRVWDIRLEPGERFGFHRHVLDYFWSCLDRRQGARTSRRRHHGRAHLQARRNPARDPRQGHHKVHDLENTGPNELHFTTVEFLDSANKPLPVPDSVRMK